jgi:endonuclease/exonuclease/phosphatase family metal-dependent hydrolase
MKVLSPSALGLFLALSVTISGFGEAEKDRTFNIMTYNIRMNTPADGVNAWPYRKDKVVGLIRFHRADVLGVQEALPEQMKDLKASLPEFESYGVGRDDGKEAGESTAIFFRKSRFQRLDGGTFWLSETPGKPGLGWDAKHNRTCTWLKFKDRATGRSFYHFNTHLDNVGKAAREESAKLLLQFMARTNKDNLPLVLTGDFNATKETPPIQKLRTVLCDSRDKSLSEPYGPRGTTDGFQVKEKVRVIDYIFINQKVAVARHGVLSDSFGLFYPSDHLPVLAEVRLQ